MACCSAASSSTAPWRSPTAGAAATGAGADARTGMVRNVTTQSAHAVARAVQVSQSMIMRRTLATTTDNARQRRCSRATSVLDGTTHAPAVSTSRTTSRSLVTTTSTRPGGSALRRAGG